MLIFLGLFFSTIGTILDSIFVVISGSIFVVISDSIFVVISGSIFVVISEGILDFVFLGDIFLVGNIILSVNCLVDFSIVFLTFFLVGVLLSSSLSLI